MENYVYARVRVFIHHSWLMANIRTWKGSAPMHAPMRLMGKMYRILSQRYVFYALNVKKINSSSYFCSAIFNRT